MATAFETEVCSRCGGTGHYSFNGEHSRCYKCDGKNGARAYTKRGAAAKEYYLSMLEIRASEVKIGDLIYASGAKIRVKDVSVKPRTTKVNGKLVGGNSVTLLGSNLSIVVGEDSTVRKVPSEEEKKIFVEKALAYQDTLTKVGTSRKMKG